MNAMNPQNLMNLLSNYKTNPLFSRAQQIANGKNEQELEQIARNICQEKGINFDQAMSQFKQIQSLLPK